MEAFPFKSFCVLLQLPHFENLFLISICKLEKKEGGRVGNLPLLGLINYYCPKRGASSLKLPESCRGLSISPYKYKLFDTFKIELDK